MIRKSNEGMACRGSGFTLIELMIVVAIVGILVAAAAPAMEHAMWRARAAKIISDFYIVRDAAIKYYADNGRWPPDRWPGQDIPELREDLSVIRWSQDYSTYDWEVWVNAAGQPTQPQTGVAVGFSLVTTEERLIKKLEKGYTGDLRPTLAGHYTFVIIPL